MILLAGFPILLLFTAGVLCIIGWLLQDVPGYEDAEQDDYDDEDVEWPWESFFDA